MALRHSAMAAFSLRPRRRWCLQCCRRQKHHLGNPFFRGVPLRVASMIVAKAKKFCLFWEAFERFVKDFLRHDYLT